RNRPSGPSAGKGDHRREAALWGALDRQARLAPVELPEPAPGVGETHALPQRGAVGALAVVADLDPQGAPLPRCPDPHAPALLPGTQPVAEGVLHQRLEEERRDPRLLALGGNVEADLDPVLVPDALDLQVHPEHPDLVGQGDALVSVGPERGP